VNIASAQERHSLPCSDPPDLERLVSRVRPFTMAATESLAELGRQVYAALVCGIPGAFVECGTWRGGSSFLMASILQQAGEHGRKVWMFDSFEGLPPPQEIDGPTAMSYPQQTTTDNCKASLEEVTQTAVSLGLESQLEMAKGWFDQTLPVHRPRIGPIALLRIDADWHASVRCCLDNLYDQVVDGGLVYLDDYFFWDGCAVAVHEFLGERRLPHRIEAITGDWDGRPLPQAAVFRKGEGTWAKLRDRICPRELAIPEIVSLVPPGGTFILVDEDRWEMGRELQGLRCIPFLEHEGAYWGPPADDQTAIRELRRLRQSGARFIVFARHSFWWLDYYAEFRNHLYSQHHCLLENGRLVAFELRPDRH